MTRPLPWASESAEDVSESQALEAFASMMTMLLASLPRPPARPAGPMPMLTVQQTAALLGMSRMTVIRMADAGELPCVVVSRGTRQKMRRFPRAAIEELAVNGGGGAHVELTEYTASWLAAKAAGPGRQAMLSRWRLRTAVGGRRPFR
jgi:excisionase family DNA binding protein